MYCKGTVLFLRGTCLDSFFYRSEDCSHVCHIAAETSCPQSTVAGHNGVSRLYSSFHSFLPNHGSHPPLLYYVSTKVGQGHREKKWCLLVPCPGHTHTHTCSNSPLLEGDCGRWEEPVILLQLPPVLSDKYRASRWHTSQGHTRLLLHVYSHSLKTFEASEPVPWSTGTQGKMGHKAWQGSLDHLTCF